LFFLAQFIHVHIMLDRTGIVNMKIMILVISLFSC
jgi:hypothetical protein